MKKILLLVIAIGLSLTMQAQKKITEGKLTAKQTITTDNEAAKAQLEQMGALISTTYFKGDKTRTELSNPMSGDVTTITNPKSVLTLMDNPAFGKKYTLVDVEEASKQVTSVEVEEGSETKTILGYECKQYKITVKQDVGDMEMILYATEQLPVKSQQSALIGDKFKGYPLYMIMKMNQMGMNMEITTEITAINEETVSDSKFNMTPPEGYEKM